MNLCCRKLSHNHCKINESKLRRPFTSKESSLPRKQPLTLPLSSLNTCLIYTYNRQGLFKIRNSMSTLHTIYKQKLRNGELVMPCSHVACHKLYSNWQGPGHLCSNISTSQETYPTSVSKGFLSTSELCIGFATIVSVFLVIISIYCLISIVLFHTYLVHQFYLQTTFRVPRCLPCVCSTDLRLSAVLQDITLVY